MKKLNSWSMVAAAAILTACSANDYVGDTSLSEDKTQSPIVFEGTPKQITNGTRAEGSSAAGYLGGEFNVYGVKNTSANSAKYTPVFDDWTVWYLGGAQETGSVTPGQEATSANYAGWEYVSETLSDNTLPTNDYIKINGEFSRRSVLAATSQKVRIWDKSATDYWFYAVSAPVTKGVSETNTWEWKKTEDGLVSHCLINNVTDKNTILYANAINAKVSSVPSDKAVRFSFYRLMSKVRFAFYERIKGYAIKDVKFYVADDNGEWKDGEAGSSSNLILKGVDGQKLFVPSDGAQYKITYADDGVASAEFVDDGDATKKSFTKEFGKLLLNRKMDGHTDGVSEYMANGIDEVVSGNEDSKFSWVVDATNSAAGTGNYLGSDNKCYWAVAPNNNGEINIKVSYTMVSNDTQMEEIKRTASVKIPAESCKWEPNHGYTYKFKISGDNGDVIFFDGVVVDESFSDSMENNFAAE